MTKKYQYLGQDFKKKQRNMWFKASVIGLLIGVTACGVSTIPLQDSSTNTVVMNSQVITVVYLAENGRLDAFPTEDLDSAQKSVLDMVACDYPVSRLNILKTNAKTPLDDELTNVTKVEEFLKHENCRLVDQSSTAALSPLYLSGERLEQPVVDSFRNMQMSGGGGGLLRALSGPFQFLSQMLFFYWILSGIDQTGGAKVPGGNWLKNNVFNPIGLTLKWIWGVAWPFGGDLTLEDLKRGLTLVSEKDPETGEVIKRSLGQTKADFYKNWLGQVEVAFDEDIEKKYNLAKKHFGDNADFPFKKADGSLMDVQEATQAIANGDIELSSIQNKMYKNWFKNMDEFLAKKAKTPLFRGAKPSEFSIPHNLEEVLRTPGSVEYKKAVKELENVYKKFRHSSIPATNRIIKISAFLATAMVARKVLIDSLKADDQIIIQRDISIKFKNALKLANERIHSNAQCSTRLADAMDNGRKADIYRVVLDKECGNWVNIVNNSVSKPLSLIGFKSPNHAMVALSTFMMTLKYIPENYELILSTSTSSRR